MDHTAQQQIDDIIDSLQELGKENLEEILHKLTEGVQFLVAGGRCRIYLEDLSMGSLVCTAATGSNSGSIGNSAFAINRSDLPVPRAYQQRQELAVNNLAADPDAQTQAANGSKNGNSYLIPIVHLSRAIGVLCLDHAESGPLPTEAQLRRIRKFLAAGAQPLDRARKYHQQIQLARRVDEAKKRDAALFMVQSAAQLVDNVALATVLVPKPLEMESDHSMHILAAYSKEPEAGKLYEEERLINLTPGESLVSRFIDRAGVITDDALLAPLYINDLKSETLQKRYLTEELGLKSLYMVPRYDKRTRRVICLVNYYTKARDQFSPFERDLLEAHAEMAQRVVLEIGDEHLEVQILAEIGELLQQSSDGLKPFLHRVLSKATQLIGADTGSIALVRERHGERRLLVDDEQGHLVGAKNKGWLKKYIPPIKVGGPELPLEERSLTGLAAANGRAEIMVDSLHVEANDHFYIPVTEAIRSEIAVPIKYDGEVLAVICLDSLRPHYFTSEHRRILLIIERMIGHHLAILQKLEQLTSEIDRLRQDVGYKDPSITSYRLGNIIGNSSATRDIIHTIERIGPPLCRRMIQWQNQGAPDLGEFLGLPSILITGETGAGKEFLFNNLFDQLNRLYREILPRGKALPLKKTNIAAYSGELTYSELFGHKRGAFTGAHNDRRGILEEARGGVVFLDEIGDADPKTQVQLLRFLDSGEFVRLGENITRHSQLLLVAGTNRDLRQLIDEGKFREDLYHRLSELIIEVPSLNDRREDIPDLAVHFLGRLFHIYHQPEIELEEPPVLSEQAKEILKHHHYSGNIRELRSTLLRAMLFRQSQVIQGEEIEKALQPQSPHSRKAAGHEQEANRIATALLQRITAGQADFWSAVYRPYAKQDMTREVVLKLIEKARTEGATNMPKLARMLNACDPAAESREEKKTFFRFKNFLYKTVRIR